MSHIPTCDPPCVDAPLCRHRGTPGDVPGRPDLGVVQVGDIVTRSAKGKLWRVTDFWTTAQGELFASLAPVVGYTNASHPVDQLVVVERPGVTP